ncbi:MAG: acyltransferase [Lachnospiraceae bacterium]|nr:acyltransferase [Lachnospiraceae bacterium]
MSVAKKKPIPYLNIMRAASAIMVVLFHYCYTFVEYQIPGTTIGLLASPFGNWGAPFVYVFFMVSGASLYYNHDHLSGLKDVLIFWKKRFLSLFPMFYVAWAIMYVINSNKFGSWYWGGPRKKFLYTLFAMDGYLMHHGQNYYCLGEWFLGAIVILYALYPILVFSFNHFRFLSGILVTALYVLNINRHQFSSLPDTNIFIVLIKYYNSHIMISDNMCLWTCLFSFYMGLFFIEYREKLITKPFAALSLLGLIAFGTFQIPVSPVAANGICGIFFYVLIASFSNQILSVKPLKIAIDVLSKYSYGIFLVHHVILYEIMQYMRGIVFNPPLQIALFIAIYLVILLAGFLLQTIVNSGMKLLSSIPKRLQAAIQANR